MLHLLILIFAAFLAWQTVVLVCRLIWLAALIVAWLAVAAWTAVLAMALGVQKLSQVVGDWRWRRRYGEILPPE
jgi:hypothetical protein